MNSLVKSIQEGSYEIQGGSLDPQAFHVCLLALIMEVSGLHILRNQSTLFLQGNASCLWLCSMYT